MVESYKCTNSRCGQHGIHVPITRCVRSQDTGDYICSACEKPMAVADTRNSFGPSRCELEYYSAA
jgi:hypothetical protein